MLKGTSQRLRRISLFQNRTIVKAVKKYPSDTSKLPFKPKSSAEEFLELEKRDKYYLNLFANLRLVEVPAMSQAVLRRNMEKAGIIFVDMPLKPEDYAISERRFLMEGELIRVLGPNYKKDIQEFFEAPYLSEKSLDLYLQMNPVEYKKIIEQRADKLLDYFSEVSQFIRRDENFRAQLFGEKGQAVGKKKGQVFDKQESQVVDGGKSK